MLFHGMSVCPLSEIFVTEMEKCGQLCAMETFLVLNYNLKGQRSRSPFHT